MDHATYSHSGKIGMLGLAAPVIGGVAALVVALPYAYVTVYSPFVGYLTMLLLTGFVIALMASVIGAGVLLKVRSRTYMALVGLSVGLFALYASWAAFESVLIARLAKEGTTAPGFLELLGQPREVWRIAGVINEHGWYSIVKVTPSGVVLWGLWGIEALIIVGGVAGTAPLWLATEVYCETCDRWCEDANEPVRLRPPANPADLQPALEGPARMAETLERLDEAGPDEPHIALHMKRCEECKLLATAQLTQVVETVDAEGRATRHTTPLTAQHLVQPRDFARLAALAGKVTPRVP